MVKLFQKHFISFFEMERPLYCSLSLYLITDDIFHSFALVFVIQLLSFLFTALKQIVPDFISISFLPISYHYLSSSLSSLPLCHFLAIRGHRYGRVQVNTDRIALPHNLHNEAYLTLIILTSSTTPKPLITLFLMSVNYSIYTNKRHL